MRLRLCPSACCLQRARDQTAAESQSSRLRCPRCHAPLRPPGPRLAQTSPPLPVDRVVPVPVLGTLSSNRARLMATGFRRNQEGDSVLVAPIEYGMCESMTWEIRAWRDRGAGDGRRSPFTSVKKARDRAIVTCLSSRRGSPRRAIPGKPSGTSEVVWSHLAIVRSCTRRSCTSLYAGGATGDCQNLKVVEDGAEGARIEGFCKPWRERIPRLEKA